MKPNPPPTYRMHRLSGQDADLFKRCPNCGAEWWTRDQLLRDPSIKLVGYQVNFKRLKAGILMFNHSCRTTLALKVEVFQDLYRGAMFEKCAAGTDACGGFCLHEGDLRSCPAECECAYIRHILQVIKIWPKESPAE